MLILQAAPPAAGPGGFDPFLLVMLGMLAIFWFLVIGPQRKRYKQHQAKLAAIARGDTVVTNGGLVDKVTKVTDDELTVDFGGNKMQVMKMMVADVRGRAAPANDRK